MTADILWCNVCEQPVRVKGLFGTLHFCLNDCEVAQKSGRAQHASSAKRTKRYGFLWLRKATHCDICRIWLTGKKAS